MNLREQFKKETKEELYYTFQEYSGASIEEHGFSEEYVEWLEQKLVNKTNDIHDFSGTYSKEDMEQSFEKGGDWRIACKNLSEGKITKLEWSENHEDFEEFISNYR